MRFLSLFFACALSFSVEGATLRECFSTPPEDAKLQTWFHWVSDFVTQEGLKADLKAMGEMEIGTAHIFMPGMAHLPSSPKPLSEEWWPLLRTAIEEAKKNNIHLGIHNCPGWSSSGGPWITPENSMKLLVASELDLTGQPATVKLPQPNAKENFYRDVSVLAFPIEKLPVLESIHASFPLNPESLRKNKAAVPLPITRQGQSCEIHLTYQEAFSPKFCSLQFVNANLSLKGNISASADGKEYIPVASFTYSLFNAPQTPKIIQLKSLPTPCRSYKITFRHHPAPVWIGNGPFHLRGIAFSSAPMIADVDGKNSAGTTYQFHPPASEHQPGLDPQKIVNISKQMDKTGTLRWSPPGKGHWRILRIGYTTTGKKCAPATLPGLECDKLSKRGLDAHWPHMMARILAFPGAKDVFRISLIDSYEVGGQNWTEDLPAEFQSRRGYSLFRYLPALLGYAVETEGVTARFLFDYQRTIAELFAENYYDYFTQLCHKNGILAASEPYGGPFDSLRCGASADVPTGEFWLGRPATGSPRIASSIGHLYQRKKIAAEAFTTDAKEGRWQITPKELRRTGEAGWLEGISQLVYHSYCHQPLTAVQPGISLGRHGTQLNRNTTWWKEGVHWSRYVRRAQSLLQTGKPRAEALLFTGESTPKRLQYPSDLILEGFQFDYCGVDALQDLVVSKDGGIGRPGQIPYDFLFLGADRFLSVKTLQKIDTLLRSGARIAGQIPTGTPTLSDKRADWENAVANVKARLTIANTPSAAAKAFDLRPDLISDVPLRRISRQHEGTIYHFIVNKREFPITTTITCSAPACGTPEFWDPRTGTMTKVAAWKRIHANQCQLSLYLPAAGSGFLVFPPSEEAPSTPPLQTIDAPIQFAEILSANYHAKGDATKGADVSDQIKTRLKKREKTIQVSNALFGDPAPNRPKILDIRYRLSGKEIQETINEFDTITLAAPIPPAAEAILLEGNTAAFVFKKPGQIIYQRADNSWGQTRVNENAFPAEIDLTKNWTVRFSGKAAPQGSFVFPELLSWSKHEKEEVRSFAGRAHYTRTFQMTKEQFAPMRRWILTLGEVREMANITLNGKNYGCLWDLPFEVDLTSGLLEGENRLEIEVINTWPNRLISDAKRRKTVREPYRGAWPEWVLDNKPDSGTGIYTWSNFGNGWEADEPLLPAGLLGPTKLRAVLCLPMR